MRHRNNRILAAIHIGRGPFLRDAPTDDKGEGSGDANSGGNDGDKDAGKGQGEGGKKPEVKGDYDPDRAMADLGKARDDAKREKDARVKAEADQQAKMDAVLIALGIKPDPKDDPAATAAKVAKELTDAQAANKELTIENAVLKLAGKAGGNANRLLDSRSFAKTIAELDPSAKDFDKSVTDAIKDAVKADPSLAATASTGGQGPAKQGADISGSGGGANTRPVSLAAAIAARNAK